VQLYTYTNDCKAVGNIPGSYFVKAFSALCCILNDVSSITMFISVKGTGKNQLQPGQERMEVAPVLSHFFFYEIHDQK
jgi:hypothetical protein